MSKKKYKITKDKLSYYAAEALSTPFAGKDSVPRLFMFKSALSNSVSPVNAERPYVDSHYSKNLIVSTDNYVTEGRVRLLRKIEKVINGMVTERAYIYYDYHTNKVEMEIVPLYEKYYRFGYGVQSELEGLEEGEDSIRPVYTKHTSNMDPEDGGMAYGGNLNIIYTSSKDVGEDAIVITEKAAKRLAINHMDEIEILYLPEASVLKDLYGFTDENGVRVYRPFPLPGEYVTKESVVSVCHIGTSFLATSNTPEDADNTKVVHAGAMVVDVEVYSNEKLNNVFVEDLRQAQKKYIKDIVSALNKLHVSEYHELFSDDLIYKMHRYNSILRNQLRVEAFTLDKKTWIKIKTINIKPIGIGSKLTNRDGGKGTVSLVLKDDLVADDGTEIDALINVTGIVNRENPGQLFEKDLNTLNIYLMKYLNKSNDSIDVKYDNILKWVELAQNYELLELLQNSNKEDVVEVVAEECLRLKYDPYDNNMDFLAFHKLREFTDTLHEIKEHTIYRDGKPFSSGHMYGHAFYLVLENGPEKDTSIRSDGMTNIKGALSKKGASKKKHQTKWGSTAVKISDLGLSIMLNYLKFKHGIDILNNDLSILTDYSHGLGIEFSVSPKESNSVYFKRDEDIIDMTIEEVSNE